MFVSGTRNFSSSFIWYEKLVKVFWYQFPVPVSGACVIAIRNTPMANSRFELILYRTASIFLKQRFFANKQQIRRKSLRCMHRNTKLPLTLTLTLRNSTNRLQLNDLRPLLNLSLARYSQYRGPNLKGNSTLTMSQSGYWSYISVNNFHPLVVAFCILVKKL